MFGDNRPDKFEVDPEILMNDYVPERNDLCPRDLRMPLAQAG